MSKDEDKENARMKKILYENLDMSLEKLETQSRSIENLEVKLQGGGSSEKR